MGAIISGRPYMERSDRSDMLSGHDRIRDNFISACSGALLSPGPRITPTPGDIFVSLLNAGQPAALDATVTSPLWSSLVINASERSSFALLAAENRKYEQQAQTFFKVGLYLDLLVFESFEEFLETVRKNLKQIDSQSDKKFAAGRVVVSFQ